MKFFAITALLVVLAVVLAVPALGAWNFHGFRNKCVNDEGILLSTHSSAAVGGTCG